MIHHSTEQTLGYSRRDKSEEIDIVQAQRPKINVRTSFEEPPEWGFSRCRSFLTIKPTPIGPTSVQSTTAHVITRKILWLEAAISEALEAAGCTVRVPALEDNEAIRKPISPRAIIANEMIDAGRCGAYSWRYVRLWPRRVPCLSSRRRYST